MSRKRSYRRNKEDRLDEDYLHERRQSELNRNNNVAIYNRTNASDSASNQRVLTRMYTDRYNQAISEIPIDRRWESTSENYNNYLQNNNDLIGKTDYNFKNDYSLIDYRDNYFKLKEKYNTIVKNKINKQYYPPKQAIDLTITSAKILNKYNPNNEDSIIAPRKPLYTNNATPLREDEIPPFQAYENGGFTRRLRNRRRDNQFRRTVRSWIRERDANREVMARMNRALREVAEVLNEDIVTEAQQELPEDVNIGMPLNEEDRPVQMEDIEEIILPEVTAVASTSTANNQPPPTHDEIRNMIHEMEDLQEELRSEVKMRKAVKNLRKAIAPWVIAEWYKKYKKVKTFKHKRARKIVAQVFEEWKKDAANNKKNRIRNEAEIAREARLARFNNDNPVETQNVVNETLRNVDINLPDLTPQLNNKLDNLKKKLDEIKKRKVAETKRKIYSEIAAPQRHEDPEGFDPMTFWQEPPPLPAPLPEPPITNKKKNKGKAPSNTPPSYNVTSGDNVASTSGVNEAQEWMQDVINNNNEQVHLYVDENGYLVTEDEHNRRKQQNIPNMQYNTELENIPISTTMGTSGLHGESIHPRTVLTTVPRPNSELYEQDIRLENINTEEEETRREELVSEYLSRHSGPAKIKVQYLFINDEPYIKTYLFDIYKYKGRNAEVRGKYVLYYDKKKDAIGISYVDKEAKGTFIPDFKPIFEKRNRFYLAVLDSAEISHLPTSNVYMKMRVENSNNVIMANMNYTGRDYMNKEDKYVEVPGLNDQIYEDINF